MAILVAGICISHLHLYVSALVNLYFSPRREKHISQTMTTLPSLVPAMKAKAFSRFQCDNREDTDL